MSFPEPRIESHGETPATLFPGDTGELPLETRRVLIQLLAGPSLDGRRHAKLWPVLLRDETIVSRRLSELFLTLVIDRDLQVAFTRQAEAGDLEIPVLLRRAPLTFVDSVILLFLRQRLMQSESRGERAVISIPEIAEYLSPYERSVSTDHAGFLKRVNASIEKIKKHSILQRIRSTDDRLEISPTLKLLFSAEEVQALTTIYRGLLQDGGRVSNETVSATAAESDSESDST
jgi:hypothetical protein